MGGWGGGGRVQFRFGQRPTDFMRSVFKLFLFALKQKGLQQKSFILALKTERCPYMISVGLAASL